MAAKRKTSTTPPVIPSSVIDIGIDIGYGYTKTVGYGKPIVFPSVIGYPRDLGFQTTELTAKYAGDQITDDDGKWFVGELASTHLTPAEHLTLNGRTASEAEQGNAFRLRLMKVALGKLFKVTDGSVIHVRIATGLPVDHMGDAPELKQALSGQHVISTDAAYFIANVTEVMVMPQAYGALYAEQLKDDGSDDECYTAEITTVLDVGTFTVDLATDRNGEFISARSGSRESGVHMVEERVAAQYNRDYRTVPDKDRVRSIMRNPCFKIHGKKEGDYTNVVKDATAPLIAAALGLLNEKIGVGVDVDLIAVIGGGADLIIDEVSAVYPQAKLAADAQLRNAIGYWRYAKSTLLD